MSRNPRSVHQFRALRALDRFFGLPDTKERRKRYDAALERLRDGDFDLTGPTVAGVERSDDVKGATDPMAHLEEHWLGDDYWPSISSDTVKSTLPRRLPRRHQRSARGQPAAVLDLGVRDRRPEGRHVPRRPRDRSALGDRRHHHASSRGRRLNAARGIGHRRVKVRWVTPLGDETASMS